MPVPNLGVQRAISRAGGEASHGPGGDSNWAGRGAAEGFAFLEDTAAEGLDLLSDHSGGLVSYFARPAEKALRERAAALREWSEGTKPEDTSGWEDFGQAAVSLGVSAPAYIGAIQAGGLIKGMGAMGYLRGRPEGEAWTEAAKEMLLGATMRGTETFGRLGRLGINALVGGKVFEPEGGYQEPSDFLIPAVIGVGAALPKARPVGAALPNARTRARGEGGRRSAKGEQPGSQEPPRSPATPEVWTEADALRVQTIASESNIGQKEALAVRIGELKGLARKGDKSVLPELARLEKTQALAKVGETNPRLEHRGERSVFVQRNMDQHGMSEVDATRAWRDELRKRVGAAPESPGLEGAEAAASEARAAVETIKGMKPRELYEAGLLGKQQEVRPRSKKLGNEKRKLLRAAERKADRLEKLESAERRLAEVEADGGAPGVRDTTPRAAAGAAASRAVGSSVETTLPGVTVTKTGPDSWVDGSGVPYSDVNVDALTPTPRAAATPVPLVERPGPSLSLAEEAQLQGVSPELISALERAPKPGPKRVDANGRQLPEASHGGPMARGRPRATADEVEQLTLAGFLDNAGNLTEKGAETLAARRNRFDTHRKMLIDGEPVPRQVMLEWPHQMERAARLTRTAQGAGPPKKPGADPADDLSVDDMKLVDDMTLENRRTLDEERGRLALREMEEATTPRLSAAEEIKIQDAAVELAEVGGFELLPASVRPFYEQVMDLITSNRLPVLEVGDVLQRHGLTLADLGHAYGLTVRQSAQTLTRHKQMGDKIAMQFGVRELKDVKNIIEVTGPRREALKEALEDPNLSKSAREALELQLSWRYLTRKEIAELKLMGTDKSIVKGMGMFRRLENIRRGLLVSQVATSMRNAMTQVGNLKMAMVQEINDRAIKATFQGTGVLTGNKYLKAYGDSIHPVRSFAMTIDTLQELAARIPVPRPSAVSEKGLRGAVVDSWRKEGTDIVTRILSKHAKEGDLLTSSFNSDIAATVVARAGRGKANRIVDRALDGMEVTANVLNTLNRFQEHVFRRGVFRAELGRQMEMNPLKIGKKTYTTLEQLEADDLLGSIPQLAVKRAVEKSLDMTWAKNFDKESAVAPFISLINRVPVLSWFMPFPRFVANSIQWQLEHSPLGVARYFSPQQRANLAAGDISGITKTMAGTTLFFAALDLAKSEYATGKWYLFKNTETGEMADIRPYAPFAGYAFAAYLWTRGIEPKLSEGAATAINVGTQIAAGPTGLAYNVIKEMAGGEGWDQIKARPGEPVRLHNITIPEMVQGFAASNARAGLGLYALDKVLGELFTNKRVHMAPETDPETGEVTEPSFDPGIAGAGMSGFGKGGEVAGSVLGNVVASYAVPLNQIWDGYKQFKKWEGDLEATEVKSTTAFQMKMNPDTGKEEPMPYEGFVDNFTSNFENQIASRIPFSDLPSANIPTRRAPPRSHEPGIKLATGIIFKEPLNRAQELADKYDLSLSDIVPSTGNAVWDDLVEQKLGNRIFRDVTARVSDVGTPMSKDYARLFENKEYYEKVQTLRDLFRAAANKARQEARKEAPMLWDLVQKSKRDYREVGALREKRNRAMGRIDQGAEGAVNE